MKTSALLLSGHRDLWARLVTHPFVAATADGTLPEDAFARWLLHDHAFVVGFRRFVGRLVELAPSEPARDMLTGSLVTLQPELELFRAEAARRGVDLDAEPSLTAVGYTSYLLAATADGWPVALTVLYGAEKAYVDAWSAVRARADESSPYWGFVDNWSSPAFRSWVDAVAELVDDLPWSAELDRTFARVVRFELAFWDDVWATAPPTPT